MQITLPKALVTIFVVVFAAVGGTLYYFQKNPIQQTPDEDIEVLERLLHLWGGGKKGKRINLTSFHLASEMNTSSSVGSPTATSFTLRFLPFNALNNPSFFPSAPLRASFPLSVIVLK